MGLLSTITSAAGSLLGGDTLKDVGGIIDNLHTSYAKFEESPVSSFLSPRVDPRPPLNRISLLSSTVILLQYIPRFRFKHHR